MAVVNSAPRALQSAKITRRRWWTTRLRAQGRFRLAQLDAMDEIALVERAIDGYRSRFGARPLSWDDLIRAGILRAVPVDPTDHALRLDPASGRVTLAPDSPLNPLPDPERPA